LTFEIAKYRIFLLELRIDTKSSKEYLLFGGFVLSMGKSIKISEFSCFLRRDVNSFNELIHARFIRKIAFFGSEIS
jgi:hypothetical protein